MNRFRLAAESDQVMIRLHEEKDYENWYYHYQIRRPPQHKFDEGPLDLSRCTWEWFQAIVNQHQQLASQDISYVFGVFRRSDGAHLGVVDLSTLMRDHFQWGRVGYTIHNQFWRRGYAKESVRLLLKLAFHQLYFHRIEAHIDTENLPSVKVAQSAGMSLECVREAFLYDFNEWRNCYIYYQNKESCDEK